MKNTTELVKAIAEAINSIKGEIMDFMLSIGLLLTPILIGFIDIVLSIRKCNHNSLYVTEFYNDFIKYGNSQGKDYKTYDSLIRESIKIQNMLGGNGILYNYKPAYANYSYPSIQVIVNFLPDLNKEFYRERSGRYPSDEIIQFFFNTIRECLIRYQGVLNNRKNNFVDLLRNPLKIFNHGVKTILHFPFFMLASFGLISEDMSEKAFSNKIFNSLGALISTLGLLSTMITIVTGWKPFIVFLKNFYG